MAGIGVLGLTDEELAVGRLGLLEAPGFVVFEGLVKRGHNPLRCVRLHLTGIQ
ncbi:MAG: hypothetical protein O7I42_17550 [Alphaproteobacteria bacterium]|nr:hypothetical protein [Alphaproteobacteria bacterium]